MDKFKEIIYRIGLIETILEENGLCFRKNGKIIASVRPPTKAELRLNAEFYAKKKKYHDKRLKNE